MSIIKAVQSNAWFWQGQVPTHVYTLHLFQNSFKLFCSFAITMSDKLKISGVLGNEFLMGWTWKPHRATCLVQI